MPTPIPHSRLLVVRSIVCAFCDHTLYVLHHIIAVSTIMKQDSVLCFSLLLQETKMTRRWFRLSCGVGSVFNDFWRQMALSFGLVFYTKVIGLSSSQAGLILAVGQLTALFSTAIFGYLCDKVDVPFLSHRLGRKKTWHLFCTVLLAFFLLMAFSRCFACNESTSSWVEFAYFACAYGGAAFMYGALEMAHLSFIPVVSESQDEAIILNTLR